MTTILALSSFYHKLLTSDRPHLCIHPEVWPDFLDVFAFGSGVIWQNSGHSVHPKVSAAARVQNCIFFQKKKSSVLSQENDIVLRV